MGLQQDVHWWYQNRSTEICLINGSRIYFRTLSDPEQFKSYEFGFIEFEEGSMIDESAFTLLLGRLRQQKRPEWDDHFCYNFFIHTNPGGMRGWIYKRFINPKTRNKKYRYINAPSTQNIHLHDEYIETLEEAYSAEQIKEMIQGVDNDYDNTVAFPDFDEHNIITNIPYNPNVPLILTCDFNYNPMCWYLAQTYNDCWFIFEELVVDNIMTSDMCRIAQAAINKYGVRSFDLMGDAAGRQMKTNGSDYGIMVNYFTERGYDVIPRVQKSNPTIKERLAVLRGYIKNAKGKRRLFVNESCKKLLYNFDVCKNSLSNGGLKKPSDTEIQKNNELKYLTHPIDAISYPIWFYNNYKAITSTKGDDTNG